MAAWRDALAAPAAQPLDLPALASGLQQLDVQLKVLTMMMPMMMRGARRPLPCAPTPPCIWRAHTPAAGCPCPSSAAGAPLLQVLLDCTASDDVPQQWVPQRRPPRRPPTAARRVARATGRSWRPPKGGGGGGGRRERGEARAAGLAERPPPPLPPQVRALRGGWVPRDHAQQEDGRGAGGAAGGLPGAAARHRPQLLLRGAREARTAAWGFGAGRNRLPPSHSTPPHRHTHRPGPTHRADPQPSSARLSPAPRPPAPPPLLPRAGHRGRRPAGHQHAALAARDGRPGGAAGGRAVGHAVLRVQQLQRRHVGGRRRTHMAAAGRRPPAAGRRLPLQRSTGGAGPPGPAAAVTAA
jgi:hypothetical protein